VRPVDKEGKDLASVELSRFANADLELARGPLGDSDVPIVFREDNGVGTYKSEMCQISGWGKYDRCQGLSRRRPNDDHQRRRRSRGRQTPRVEPRCAYMSVR
jgi:hypothetical protein